MLGSTSRGAPDQQSDIPAGRAIKRKYTSKACEECRRRRAKCDGAKPACTRCAGRGIECHFRFEEDGRRPAPKSYVQLLRNRIEVLERALRANGIDVDAAVAQAIADGGPVVAPSADPHAPTSFESEAGASSTQVEELCVAFERALSLDESLNFDQDGEIRYYGPTSGRMDFQPTGYGGRDSPLRTQSDNTSRYISPLREHTILLRAADNEVQVPTDLKAELIDNYFTWDGPWFHVVNEELFRKSEPINGRYSSPLLLNCILAIGSRFSDRTELRTDPNDANTAGKAFLEKAGELLQYELKFPSITTVQALSLIGTMYFAIGADAPGWMHHGMGMRLALDLGLNLDAAALSGSHLIPSEELELRRQLYWAMYTNDKLAAGYTGRVCTMLDAQGSVNINSNSKPFQTAMMSLSRIYEKIMTNLYAPKPLLRGPQKIPFLSSCILELKTWFYDLPPGMRIDRPSRNPVCPQVYTTHMVYHTSYIILMQPFLARPRNSSQTTAAAAARPENHAMTKKANAICYEASRQLVLVARKYRQAYGSFRKSPITATHCTLSAALVLLRLARQNNDGGDGAKTISAKDIRMVEDCLQVLEELSTAWNIAKKIRASLVKLYRQLRSAPEDVGQSSRLGSPNTDSGSSATSDPLLATQMLAAEQGEAFPQAFSGDSAPGVLQSMSLADFSEEMLFDDSLWVNTELDLTLDSLMSDYNGFEILGQW